MVVAAAVTTGWTSRYRAVMRAWTMMTRLPVPLSRERGPMIRKLNATFADDLCQLQTTYGPPLSQSPSHGTAMRRVPAPIQL